MKLHVVTALALAVLCSLAQGAPKKKGLENLGNVLYIGDSITHGFRAPSYRWAMHKILVDNGIQYNEIGVEKGSHSNGIEPGTMYIAVPFQNVHAAMSSQRAYETAGRLHPEDSNRLDKTDIFDWLEVPDKADNDARKLNAKPDTCFIMLGTNDALSDNVKDGVGKHVSSVQKPLVNDIKTIVTTIRKACPKAKVYVLSIPAWADTKNNNLAKDHEVVMKRLNPALAKAFKKDFVDLNVGLVDVACTDMPGKAVKSFMNQNDQLHPTLQGDLIIAGLVARSMGIAGRSAGLPRKAAADFVQNGQLLLDAATVKDDITLANDTLTLKAEKKLETTWKEGSDVRKGFAVEFVPAVGDGAKNGWDAEGKITLTLGNGVHAGQLSVTESYIMWGGTILYSSDMSKNKDAVRVAWVGGSESQNVAKGFYVWLGDMLIGEGLPDVGAKMTGICLENSFNHDEVVKGFAADAESSAPATKNFVKEAAFLIYDEEAEPAQK